jgi:predicted alpha/beta hydrolase family esterase
MGANSCLSASLRFEHAACRGGVTKQRLGWADRPANQLAAAIGTAPTEHSLGAVAAERALEGADARIHRVRGQVFVAAFATGSQFQHHRRSEKVATGARRSL